MQTSLIETQEIEVQLLGFPAAEDRLLFEARLILQPRLYDKLQWQQQTYKLIKHYGRNQLKKEIAAAEDMLFTQSAYRSFKRKVFGIFTRK